MSGNLSDLQEALSVCREDLLQCLRDLREFIAYSHQTATMELFARLEGNIHELDLLRKRECELLANGRVTE